LKKNIFLDTKKTSIILNSRFPLSPSALYLLYIRDRVISCSFPVHCIFVCGLTTSAGRSLGQRSTHWPNLKCQFYGRYLSPNCSDFCRTPARPSSSAKAGECELFVEGGHMITHAGHISSPVTGCGSGFLYLCHTYLLATVWYGGGWSTLPAFCLFGYTIILDNCNKRIQKCFLRKCIDLITKLFFEFFEII